MEETGLIPMTPSRKRLREGDVFLAQPLREVFFCGKVIRTKVESRDAFVNGMNLIYLRLPWSRGYFRTIGNVPVTERERGLSFGFWDVPRKRFVSVEGSPLRQKPQYWTDYGLASYAVVGWELQKVLRARGENP